MVNSSNQDSSFWVRNKSFLDGIFKAGAIVFGLKLLKVALDRLDI